MQRLPYRIVTDRLVLRCWQPADAPLLKEAVDASLDHLRPWMPWAHEHPQPLDATVELLRTFRGRFDLGEDFVYGIFDAAEERVVGGSGLHTRLGAGALEIGYWIRADAAGRGLATETAAALTRAAFEFAAVDRVEIHVDPANERSLGIPRRLGFAEEATLRRRLPPQPGGEPRDVVVFTLFADGWRGSPVGEVRLSAFDALGRPA
ncbi:MAG: GNAT family N-acetyltransferase [Gaiellaceae bacterium]